MRKIQIYLERIAGAKDIPIPDYMTDGSSGMDLMRTLTKIL